MMKCNNQPQSQGNQLKNWGGGGGEPLIHIARLTVYMSRPNRRMSKEQIQLPGCLFAKDIGRVGGGLLYICLLCLKSSFSQDPLQLYPTALPGPGSLSTRVDITAEQTVESSSW